ncbi:MAG: hypothetical protein JJE52_17355 [Acidimicrobiia bacterium]|nr:hypothetical protein [Acidimicrobiia bacterium]
MQEYLLDRLEQDASTPTLDEVLDRAGGRVPLASAVDAVRADREAG